MVKQKTSFKETIRKRILITILTSVLFPLMVCVAVPFEIYSANLNEFKFSLSSFMPFCLLIAFFLTVIIFFALLFLPDLAYRIASGFIISLSLMFFVQGTYLNGKLTSLSGDNIAMAIASPTTLVVNLLVWMFVISLGIVLAIFSGRKKIISTIGVVVAMVVYSTQLISPLTVAITKKEVFMSKSEKLQANGTGDVHEIATNKNLTTISKNKNVFYFCIDRFDEFLAESALEKYPEIYGELDGFTWFQDNIAIYGHTYPATANMLTGKDLDTSKKREEFLNSVYDKNNTLSVLAENGYDINLYTDEYYSFTDASVLPEYVSNVAKSEKMVVKGKFKLSFKMIKMALYRTFPLIFKNVFTSLDSDSCNSHVEEYDAELNRMYSGDNKDVFDFVSSASFKAQEKNVFSFIHVQGCHNKKYDDNWKTGTGEATWETSVSNSFKIVDCYLKAMKEAGVYENATIIITGDHSDPYNDLKEVNEPRLTALFVKPSGVGDGALKTSMAQTSHDNIWATIMKSENISLDESLGVSVFDIPENENQTRRFIWHTYVSPLDEYTYKITGDGRNMENWELVNHTRFDDRKIYD